MATLARLDVILGLNTRNFQKSIDRAQARLKRLSRNLDNTGRNLTRTVTVPLGLAGAAAVKMANDFEAAFTKIETLVGISSNQVEEWKDEILDLAPALGRAPQELAEGMFFVTSAGERGSAALDVLTAAGKAAALGLGETAVVADAVTSALNVYGRENLSAAEATSILIATVKEGKAEASELAPVFGVLLQTANELGIGFNEVGASLAAMTRVGLKADVAATSLRALMTAILKPASQAREQLEGLGFNIEQLRATVRDKGVLVALTQLAEKIGDNVDAVSEIFPNVRSLNAVLNITGGAAEATAGIFERMAKITGQTLSDSFEIASQKADFKFRASLARLAATAIRLGETILPLVADAAVRISTVIENAGKAFVNLDESSRNFILGMVAFLGSLGPILTGLGLLAKLLAIISVSMVGWTVAVLAAGVIIVKNWDAITAAVARFIDFARPALDEFVTFLSGLWEKVKEAAIRIWPDIQMIYYNVIDALSLLWETHGDTIKKAWELTKRIVSDAVTFVLGAIEALAAFLAGDASRAWETLKNAAKGALDTMTKIAGAAWLNMTAQVLDWKAELFTTINRVIAKIAGLALAFLQIPFIDPVARAAGEAGLAKLGELMQGIATETGGARERANEFRAAADLLVAPLQSANEKLVEMQGEWVEVKGAAIDAGESTIAVFDQAGTEINRKLKGGFSTGISEGVEEGKREIAEFIAYISTLSLRMNIDTEWIQRQLAEAGLKPDTGGSIGV